MVFRTPVRAATRHAIELALFVAIPMGCLDEFGTEYSIGDEESESAAAFPDGFFNDPLNDGPLEDLSDDDAFRLSGRTDIYWTGSPVMIPVCWETDTPDATARQWVREAIESNWSRFARVNFIGWDWCTSSTQAGVHVRNLEQAIAAGELAAGTPSNANGYGRSPNGGRYLSGVSDGITLAFCNGFAGQAREDCVKLTALHEFGHALGFYHEEERSDHTGNNCGSVEWPNPSEQLLGAYDTNSVMSYCGPSGPRLSPGDIASVQKAYGRRIAGTLMSPRAKCLSQNQHNPGNPGSSAFLWDCWEDYDNQEWRYSTAGTQLEIRPGFPGTLTTCLSSWGTSDVATTDDCNGSIAQGWSFKDIELRGLGGKCVDLAAGNTSNATPIQMWECYSDLTTPAYNQNQRWNVVHQGNGVVEIRYAANPNKCVTVRNWGTSDGNILYLWDCIYPDAQGFRLLADGSIRYTYGGVTKCLDVVGPSDWQFTHGQGTIGNGSPVQLFTCSTPTLNQKWNFSGQIRKAAYDPECLDRQWGNDANGIVAWSWPCTVNSTNAFDHAQTWDYYFMP